MWSSFRKSSPSRTTACPGQTQLGEAVARYLFKLMAYKDEYEVARLLLKDEFFQRVRAQFGDDARLAFNLHPPLLRALGLKRKLRLGMWFSAGAQGLTGAAKHPRYAIGHLRVCQGAARRATVDRRISATDRIAARRPQW